MWPGKGAQVFHRSEWKVRSSKSGCRILRSSGPVPLIELGECGFAPVEYPVPADWVNGLHT